MRRICYFIPIWNIKVFQPEKLVRYKFGGGYLTEKTSEKLDIIKDVDMNVSVELGRTNRMFKDILELKPGSIIELETNTGDRIDFLVNKKVVARGEVMVIDGRFALRVTDIVGSIPDAVKAGLVDEMIAER